MAQLEAAGILIVVVDDNARTLKAHPASTRMIGTLTGTEARAEPLAGLHQGQITDAMSRVAARFCDLLLLIDTGKPPANGESGSVLTAG